jgi:anti-sigma factor (TIGR02949 family)
VACEDKALLLHAYLDGELDLLHSLELEEHLKTCTRCAQQMAAEENLRQAVRSSNLYQGAPAGLEQRIRASILISEPAPAQRAATIAINAKGAPRRNLLQWAAVAAAIVMAAILGVEFIPGLIGRRQRDLVAQEIVASHIRSLQPGHLFDVQSTDQHTVKPWFDGKLDFAPPVRDFSGQGYDLVGGRLDYIGNRDVAALVYQRRKHIINVFVWPESSGDVTPMPNGGSQETLNGYNLIEWRQGGMYLYAVSDLNSEELHQFVQFLKQ